MLALPSLTMPSSSDQDSWCASWKYRSAKSTEWRQHLAEHAVEPAVVEPAGAQDQLARHASASRSGGWAVMLSRRAPSREHAMSERPGSSRARSLWRARSTSATRAAAPARHALEDPAPVVDDHAVAIGFAPARMEARLRRRDHVAEVLDGARAQQRLPVRRPVGAVKADGHRQQLRPGGAQVPIQLRETSRHSTPRGRGARRACRAPPACAPGATLRRLAVGLGAARDVDVEQVDLVVARHARAVGIVDERGGGDPAVGAALRAAACRLRSRA